MQRLLVIDDDPDMCALVARAATSAGLDPVSSTDFEQFKAGLTADTDLVVIDLMMPKVDGIEVLRTIKNDKNLKPIPVVMLTSSREERDLAQSYALGANAYVVKPVEFQQFISAVKELGVFWGVINEPPPERN